MPGGILPDQTGIGGYPMHRVFDTLYVHEHTHSTGEQVPRSVCYKPSEPSASKFRRALFSTGVDVPLQPMRTEEQPASLRMKTGDGNSTGAAAEPKKKITFQKLILFQDLGSK